MVTHADERRKNLLRFARGSCIVPGVSFVLDRRRPTPQACADAPGWFADELPDLLARNGELAGRAAERLELPPLVLEVDGWRGGLLSRSGRLEAGVSGDALIFEMDADGWSDWVRDRRSVRSLIIMGDATQSGGTFEQLEEWELVFRALVAGSPVHEPGTVDFRGPDGRPLDLRRVFGPDDDPAEIAHFLREAGYLHLRGWLDPAEMATIAGEIDRALAHYSPDDGRSWWATLEDGSQACVRLQHFAEHSPTTARLLTSERWDRVRQACAGDDDLQIPAGSTSIEALVKPVGVVAGVSDIPWHRDCSFGGHSHKCGGLVVGISVTEGTSETGLLRAVAGSHRAASLPEPTWQANDLPVVELATIPGDVTVHVGCTAHEALPPTSRERKVMYTRFELPPSEWDDAGLVEAASARRNRVHKITSQPRNTDRVR